MPTKRVPLVHLYGGLSRDGTILTLCGRTRGQLPHNDTIILHFRGEKNLCRWCREEVEA